MNETSFRNDFVKGMNECILMLNNTISLCVVTKTCNPNYDPHANVFDSFSMQMSVNVAIL